MRPLLCGTAEVAVDAKGRFALPVRYRDALRADRDGDCCLTRSVSEPCLWLYPGSEWERVAEQLSALPGLTDPLCRALQRQVLGGAVSCRPDSQGRLLLPPELREAAGLEKRAFLIGFGNKLELWSAARFEERLAADETLLRDPGEPLNHHALLADLRL